MLKRSRGREKASMGCMSAGRKKRTETKKCDQIFFKKDVFYVIKKTHRSSGQQYASMRMGLPEHRKGHTLHFLMSPSQGHRTIFSDDRFTLINYHTAGPACGFQIKIFFSKTDTGKVVHKKWYVMMVN